ncbi:cytochrome b/b6 domain-containing protein [Pseudarthrobacter sp. SSS035]|uniref:cytochrome b/b6 domain-containing protein n=1 Tax=Pseudarthrobacter sp. SSS035 TaxID=2931399 RepID=UPI00200BB49D|nr:cytochrome b/b6 domain-containing protein [Pseudarthrobacter sp. SSS035]
MRTPEAGSLENSKPTASLAAEPEPTPSSLPTGRARTGLADTPPAVASTAPAAQLGAKPSIWSWKSNTGILTGGAAALVLAAMIVLLVRWLMTLEFLQSFLVAFPGEYHLPAGTQSGFPAWVQWQHFFNMFFIVLIIRTGLQVRTEKRPAAFWTPKWSKGGKGKISLALWLHQSLDVLWLVNGAVFVVLLIATGHWARIVPTSWEVFPNALSAVIQYISLDWPTENGWVNYNSLQQLAYFTTVFIAAPLAAITGVRMSGLWPKKTTTLNKAYPIELARAVHFPVMLYFVIFIIFHVALVLATGALRNLNHMYGGTDAVNWTGFWIFAGSLVLVVAAWFAARPLILAPIAKLSGKVSSR